LKSRDAWCIAGISVFYWICAGMAAAHRPFWYDELITWYISRMPDLAAMWATIRSGAESNMVMLHLFTKASHQIFGTGYLATRLPELLGFWIMMLGIYAFLRRRLPLTYALIGMLFPVATLAWQYAFEARAYGILLGCAGVTLAAWQSATDGGNRNLSLLAIALCMIVAMASHPFAGLVMAPLSLGELVRTVERRRIDWPVWAALCAGLPIIAVYPLVLGPVRGLDLHGVHPGISAIPAFYSEVFRIAITPLLAGAALALLASRNTDARRMEKIPRGATFPNHESTALAALVFAPVILISVYIAGAGGVFFARYGLTCVIGAACWISVLAFRAAGGSTRVGTAMLIGMAGWLVLARAKAAAGEREEPRAQYLKMNLLLHKALADGRPVVVNEPLIFLESDFYLPVDQLTRLYYLVLEPKTRKKYPWQDLSDELLVFTAQHVQFKAHLADWKDFTKRNPVFLLHTDGSKEAMQQTLLEGGWKMSLIGYNPSESLYEVAAPAAAAR
jgi:hypothetical protein